MIARGLRACINKEGLLLLRDPHALALLFVMPATFVLIMSLALQEQFRSGEGLVHEVWVEDRDRSEGSRKLLAYLGEHDSFRVIDDAGSQGPDEEAFRLYIATGFGASLDDDGARPAVHLKPGVPASLDGQQEQLFLGALREALGRARIEAFTARMAPDFGLDLAAVDEGLEVRYIYQDDEAGAAPSAVQQNVPAWLVFGVFFIAMPLATTMIRERELGMDRRLRTTPVSQASVLLGKLLPYFVLNQLQVVAMLAVGVFVVPALGGEALSLEGIHSGALAVMAVAISLAALGYALLIAVICRTTEQASLLGGTGNILLAAIGGIMVPKFIMPAALQEFAEVSPMAWGLDGLLAVLLHGADIPGVGPYAGILAAFGLATMSLAWILQHYRTT